MSSSDSRRQEVAQQTWCAAEDCSRSVQRRLEKLGRRRLRVGYGEQTVHETKRNADAFETPTLLDDEVRRRGMTVSGHEDICKPERLGCSLSAMELSAIVVGVGSAWRDRTLMTRRRAVRPRSPPIASAVQGLMECQPTLHCSSPAAVAPDTTPVTGRQS